MEDGTHGSGRSIAIAEVRPTHLTDEHRLYIFLKDVFRKLSAFNALQQAARLVILCDPSVLPYLGDCGPAIFIRTSMLLKAPKIFGTLCIATQQKQNIEDVAFERLWLQNRGAGPGVGLPLVDVRVQHGLKQGSHVRSEPCRCGIVCSGDLLEQARQAELIKRQVTCHYDIQ